MNFRTTVDAAAALRSREISATELLNQAIARIERHDDRLNAVVVRDFERARAAAAAADTALARGERRPLLGVPMTVKESFSVAGMPKTHGLPGAGKMACEQDAVAVQRLKAAGAVILGKTNVPASLADWQTYNLDHGVTRNPWDLARTPGGSSGGSAAALAAGYVPLELGSDLNGSLRVPAHCCGVYAHKPSQGLVPLRGSAPPGVPMLSVSPDVDLAVAGPMARSAADLALALDVIAGPDDAQAVAYRLALPPPRRARLAEFKVLVLEEHPMLAVSSEVRLAIQDFTERLARTGCKLASQSPLLPDLALVTRTFDPLFLSFLGANMPEPDYRALQDLAAGLPTTADSLEAAELRSLVLSHRDWIAADRIRTRVAHQWRMFFSEWDLVICPVLPTPAFVHDHAEMRSRRIDIDGTPIPYAQQAVWMRLATLAGLPATALPIGLGKSGLPIGVQAIGPYLEDRTSIAFAELVERELGGFMPPPAFAD